MAFDAQSIFANLAEKERLKGHHSAEGRAIRILSRAMNGWSSGNLAALDVLVLCDQSLEDWLKARLKLSPWATQDFPRFCKSSRQGIAYAHGGSALAKASQRARSRA